MISVGVVDEDDVVLMRDGGDFVVEFWRFCGGRRCVWELWRLCGDFCGCRVEWKLSVGVGW